MIREAIQDLNRVRQIAVIAARHGFAQFVDRSGLWSALGRKEHVEEAPEVRRQSTARRFRELLSELGPTFVKLGQILSTRADLLPAEFIDELATLQDHVPPFPREQVEAQLTAAFGKNPEQLFKEFSFEPMAAASIAQVHRAKLHDGQDVVVKVQRPGISDQIRSDLNVLRYVARLLEAVVEETGIYSPTGIVDEFEKAILEELDFLHEAGNVRAFHANNKDRPYLRVPRVFEELCTRSVLTLEFLQGVKISQAQLSAEQRATIARNIVDASFKQLFVDGLFHGDPHPGNIILLEGDVLGLLDFGVVGRLTRQMQETLVMLSLAVALKDSDSVARLLYRVGVPDGRANLSAFRADIDNILGSHLPTTLKEVDARHLLRDLLDLAVKYRIRVPKEYALLSRAAMATEGMLRTLHPDLNILEVAMPYAKQLLAGRYDPNQLQGGLMRTMLRLQSLATDVPMQLSQIMMDLETGKFAVNVRADELGTINSTLRSGAVIGFLGLCACGFIVGTFISFAQHRWEIGGVPVLGLIGTAFAAALFGAAISWYLFAGKFKKLRLASFLKKG